MTRLSSKPSEEPLRDSSGAESSRLQILLVDDDDTFCDVIAELVEMDDEIARRITLNRLRDGRDALDYLTGVEPFADRQRHPWPHLVLLDQRMPMLDGTEALRQIRGNAQTRATPVCMLSSSDEDKLVRQAYELGANFYLVKPFRLEELQVNLHKIVDFFWSVAEIPVPNEAS